MQCCLAGLAGFRWAGIFCAFKSRFKSFKRYMKIVTPCFNGSSLLRRSQDSVQWNACRLQAEKCHLATPFCAKSTRVPALINTSIYRNSSIEYRHALMPAIRFNGSVIFNSFTWQRLTRRIDDIELNTRFNIHSQIEIAVFCYSRMECWKLETIVIVLLIRSATQAQNDLSGKKSMPVWLYIISCYCSYIHASYCLTRA